MGVLGVLEVVEVLALFQSLGDEELEGVVGLLQSLGPTLRSTLAPDRVSYAVPLSPLHYASLHARSVPRSHRALRSPTPTPRHKKTEQRAVHSQLARRGSPPRTEGGRG